MPNTLGPRPPSPTNLNTRAGKRMKAPKGQLPPGPLPKGASAITTTVSASAAITERLDAKAREAKLLREVFETFAKTVDTFVASCKDDKRPIAHQISSQVAKGTHRVAISSKAAPTSARSGSTLTSQQRDDPRILVVLKQEDRLARKEPYAIRNNSRVPSKESHLTPTFLRSPALPQALKSPEMVQLCGPRSTPSIQAWDGTLIQTGSVIEDEVFAQTKLKPVSCRASRHGASPTNHNITWVISFLSPVAPFTLFSCSSVARAILKKPQIQHHNPGCQSYCHAARCNHAPTVTAHDLQGTLTAQSALLALRREHLASPPELRLINSDDTATDGIEMPTLHLLHHKTTTPPLRHPPARGKSPGREDGFQTVTRPSRKAAFKGNFAWTSLRETTSPHLAPKSLSRHKKWTRARRVRPSVPREVLVFWANVRRQTACDTRCVTQPALQLAYESACDVVCIQEPYVSAPTKKTGHPAYDCYAPTDEWNSSDPTSFELERPRVLTYVRKNSGLNAQQHRSSQDRDLLWVNVNGFLILNIYRQPTTDKVIDYVTNLAPPQNSLIGGDFNARNEAFEPGVANANRGGEIAQWSSDSGLDFIGERGVPTHQAGHVLDHFLQHTLRLDSLPRHSHPGSRQGPLEQYNYRVPESKLPKLSSLIGTGIRSLPDPSSIETHDQLDQFAATLTALFQDAIKTAGSLNRTHTFTTRGGPPNAKPSANTFLSCVRSSKRAYWRDRIDNIKTDSDLYNIISWHKLGTDLKALPSRRWPPCGGHHGKAEALRRAVLGRFSPDDDLPTDPIPITTTSSLPWLQSVTMEEVEANTIGVSSTSPGSDRITVRLLKACWEHLKDIVLSLFNRCLAPLPHPLAWKVAEVAMIPKVGKKDKSSVRSWRPIALLSCLSKGLERIIAKRIAWTALTTAPSRLLHHDAEMALSQNKQVTLVTMDVQGAFDALLRRRLLKRMGEQGWPRELLLLVDSFLTGRKARVRLEGSTTPEYDVVCGTPQGSPLSPVLYMLYLAELLNMDQTLRFGYADD
ncbi:hypothetical protein PDIDSM_1113 [Penicillium digitatum]|nr:hypothetical protein PDIDSM_1113 [Penicillium digitatum]